MKEQTNMRNKQKLLHAFASSNKDKSSQILFNFKANESRENICSTRFLPSTPISFDNDLFFINFNIAFAKLLAFGSHRYPVFPFATLSKGPPEAHAIICIC